MNCIRKLSLVVLMALCTLASSAQFTINGTVSGVPDGARLRLYYVAKNYVLIDSTVIHDGQFCFSGGRQAEPRWAIIKVNNDFTALADFYIENGTISITGERYKTKVTGTPVNEQYNRYNSEINSLFNDIYSLSAARATATTEAQRDSCTRAIKAVEKEQMRREEAFIVDYPDSPVSLRVLEFRSRKAGSAHILRLWNMLGEQNRKSKEGESVREYALRLAGTEGGAPAPDFTLAASDGREVSLKSYRGRYVLIDFWASWCAPCRAGFPALAELYRKYAGTRFTILGVSLDRKEAAWRKAIKQENAPWTQLIDLKGSVASRYAVMAIPRLVLVSPEGKIVGSYDKAEINEELMKILK